MPVATNQGGAIECGRFVQWLARKISRHQPDVRDDLVQEGRLALIELGVSEVAFATAAVKKFVGERMAEAFKEIKSTHESIDRVYGEDFTLSQIIEDSHKVSRDQRLNVSVSHPRGPRKPPKDKHARWRHKMYRLGRCWICGRRLPDREFTLCILCRAKKSRRIRMNKPAAKRGRYRSRFDAVLELMGMDLPA